MNVTKDNRAYRWLPHSSRDTYLLVVTSSDNSVAAPESVKKRRRNAGVWPKPKGLSGSEDEPERGGQSQSDQQTEKDSTT